MYTITPEATPMRRGAMKIATSAAPNKTANNPYMSQHYQQDSHLSIWLSGHDLLLLFHTLPVCLAARHNCANHPYDEDQHGESRHEVPPGAIRDIGWVIGVE